MSATGQTRWDRIYADAPGQPAAPCRALATHSHLLPAAGDALDLACGRGGNALHLAARGLTTRAWDISGVAVQGLSARARQLGLALAAEQRDVTTEPPPPEAFDVIVVSRFLERDLAPTLCAALRERGLLFYQTFIREKVSDTGPDNPAYLLAPNELLQLFRTLHIMYYHEEGDMGATDQGFRNEAMLVGQKRWT